MSEDPKPAQEPQKCKYFVVAFPEDPSQESFFAAYPGEEELRKGVETLVSQGAIPSELHLIHGVELSIGLPTPARELTFQTADGALNRLVVPVRLPS